MVFLQNAVGFFIQFLPCALMIFLPFPRESCRFSRKWIFTCVVIAAMIAAVLFAVLADSNIGSNAAPAANLFMLAAIVVTLAAYLWLVRESVIKKLLVFFVVMFYAAMQYCFVNAVNGSLSVFFHISVQHGGREVYSLYGLMLYIISDAVLLPLMTAFIMRVIREYINEVETYNMRREFSVLIVSTIIFITMMVCVDFTYYYLDYRAYLLMLTLFLVLLMYQMLVYWMICRESVRRKRENERRRADEIYRIQYEKIARDIENVRRMRHDMHHHYNSLNDMLDRGKLDEMKDYLSDVINTTVKRENEIYCKNMTVNGLLQYYIGLAGDSDIHCEVQAECEELAIEPADLTVLFGNAMENAINSCKKCTDNRWINIKIGTVQDSLAMEISNSCGVVSFDRRFDTADGFLPAEAFLSGRSSGGYGLQSIAHTAHKYDGSAKFKYNAEKGIFTSRIRLNMHTENLQLKKGA